jgi:hypothetical protein
MREVDYTDDSGRIWRVRVPDDCPEELYPSGIVVGPPAGLDDWLTEHGWPETYRIAIHNALHSRGLLTAKDVLQRGKEVQAVLLGVTRTDMQGIQNCYYQEVGGR